MTIDIFSNWLDVVYKIGVVVFATWLYLDRRNDKTHVRISALEKETDKRLDDHISRIITVEQRISNSPGHHDLAEIYKEIRKTSDSLAHINASISAQSATMSALKELVGRMDGFWRRKGE